MENGESWTPIGQNDAITWPDLQGAFLERDIKSVSNYFSMLESKGVTCMRLMLEYCHVENRYLEKPVGKFQQNMIALWDVIFQLAAARNIRLILTPFDTFWMSRRWKHHPYNKNNGGPVATKTRWLWSKEMRTAIKNRLAFATERWGSTGTIFAWDLWNEIHPVHARNEVNQLANFIEDVGGYLRNREKELYGRSHLQTVSFYGTSLLDDERIAAAAFHHPGLDFATIHYYDEAAIDRPKNTIDAAIITGMLTRKCISDIEDNRPFFDTEHGPIYTFNNRHKTLEESFDDEYFTNMQWAHFASGGAGGGMRWPYRRPHVLTKGMRGKLASIRAPRPE
jgi:mannan endo-1,4-beta-mannosidase